MPVSSLRLVGSGWLLALPVLPHHTLPPRTLFTGSHIRFTGYLLLRSLLRLHGLLRLRTRTFTLHTFTFTPQHCVTTLPAGYGLPPHTYLVGYHIRGCRFTHTFCLAFATPLPRVCVTHGCYYTFTCVTAPHRLRAVPRTLRLRLGYGSYTALLHWFTVGFCTFQFAVVLPLPVTPAVGLPDCCVGYRSAGWFVWLPGCRFTYHGYQFYSYGYTRAVTALPFVCTARCTVATHHVYTRLPFYAFAVPVYTVYTTHTGLHAPHRTARTHAHIRTVTHHAAFAFPVCYALVYTLVCPVTVAVPYRGFCVCRLPCSAAVLRTAFALRAGLRFTVHTRLLVLRFVWLCVCWLHLLHRTVIYTARFLHCYHRGLYALPLHTTCSSVTCPVVTPLPGCCRIYTRYGCLFGCLPGCYTHGCYLYHGSAVYFSRLFTAWIGCCCLFTVALPRSPLLPLRGYTVTYTHTRIRFTWFARFALPRLLCVHARFAFYGYIRLHAVLYAPHATRLVGWLHAHCRTFTAFGLLLVTYLACVPIRGSRFAFTRLPALPFVVGCWLFATFVGLHAHLPTLPPLLHLRLPALPYYAVAVGSTTFYRYCLLRCHHVRSRFWLSRLRYTRVAGSGYATGYRLFGYVHTHVRPRTVHTALVACHTPVTVLRITLRGSRSTPALPRSTRRTPHLRSAPVTAATVTYHHRSTLLRFLRGLRGYLPTHPTHHRILHGWFWVLPVTHTTVPPLPVTHTMRLVTQFVTGYWLHTPFAVRHRLRVYCTFVRLRGFCIFAVCTHRMRTCTLVVALLRWFGSGCRLFTRLLRTVRGLHHGLPFTARTARLVAALDTYYTPLRFLPALPFALHRLHALVTHTHWFMHLRLPFGSKFRSLRLPTFTTRCCYTAVVTHTTLRFAFVLPLPLLLPHLPRYAVPLHGWFRLPLPLPTAVTYHTPFTPPLRWLPVTTYRMLPHGSVTGYSWVICAVQFCYTIRFGSLRLRYARLWFVCCFAFTRRYDSRLLLQSAVDAILIVDAD